MQHLKRWLTAIILGPLVLWILFKGNMYLLASLVSAVAIFSVREYLRIIFGNDEGPISQTIKGISYGISIALVIGATLGSWQVMFLTLALDLVLMAIFVLARFSSYDKVFDAIARQVLGMLYIPASLACLIFIREMEQGTLWILWLLIVIFANDTGAFYSGTFFGKRKLAPNISPNKTIEGSMGGVSAATVLGLVFSMIFFNDVITSLVMIPCSFILALAGQVGDLFESAMKRASDIKDSGRILPGHGGMLDRIDGLLLAVPILYTYLVFTL